MFNLTLLYAEDDPQSRINYAFALEEYFSEVYVAKDGKEALDLYHEKKPDVLLLDISMPFIDGLEVAKIVRKENEEIPIIMLTAHSEQEVLLRAVNLKLEEYLIKPINEKNLKKIILKVIGKIKNRALISIGKEIKWNKMSSDLLYEAESIKLSKKERKLIELLISSRGEHLLRDTLIIQIWHDEIPDVSHDHKLHQLVYRLNKKINILTESDRPFIENSYTFGYRIKL